jgi:hypothetical protein
LLIVDCRWLIEQPEAASPPTCHDNQQSKISNQQ